MAHYKVAPVPGYEQDVLAEIRTLLLDCADGLYFLFDYLEQEDPALRERCGRIADRFELYGVTIPGCSTRLLMVTIDDANPTRPRAVHGSIPCGDFACQNGFQLAQGQLRLVNPIWEPK